MFGKLKEDMDRTGKVDGAYCKLLEARGEKLPTKRQSTQHYVSHAVHVQKMLDAGEIERVNAENRRLTEELKTAYQPAQEIGIAAGLSGDPNLIADFRSGDPHMRFAIRAGLAPEGATKLTH